MTRLFLFLALGALTARPLAAQGVTVAPHAVYIDHRTRSGSVLLHNPGTEPVEVDVSTLFGYFVTDSSGAIAFRTIDAPDSTVPSALAWIQAFPRRLVVGPRERQTVRLLARPPAGLADGEYWVRLAVSAQAGHIPISSASDTSPIKIGFDLKVRSIIGVSYRKGSVTTGVELTQLRASVVGDSLITRCRLMRRGNAAFVGTIRQTLLDSLGTVRVQVVRGSTGADSGVKSYQFPIGVYFHMEPRIVTGLGPGRLPSGRYLLRYEVVTERDDLDPAMLLLASPVRDSVQVIVP